MLEIGYGGTNVIAGLGQAGIMSKKLYILNDDDDDEMMWNFMLLILYVTGRGDDWFLHASIYVLTLMGKFIYMLVPRRCYYRYK